MIQFYFDRFYWDFDFLGAPHNRPGDYGWEDLVKAQRAKDAPCAEKGLKRAIRRVLRRAEKKPESIAHAAKEAARVESLVMQIVEAQRRKDAWLCDLQGELGKLQAYRNALFLLYREQQRQDEELLALLL